MSIAAHPGFERALADSASTASQAIWLTEWMRLGEQVAEAGFRLPTDGDPVPDTSSQEQLKCQTPPDRSERLCACGYPQPQQSRQQNSSNVSPFEMTATEIMARSNPGVES